MKSFIRGSLILIVAWLGGCSGMDAPLSGDAGLQTAVAGTMLALDSSSPAAVPGETPEAHGLAPTEAVPPAPIPSVPMAAYIDNGNVWLIEATAAPRQLTTSGRAQALHIAPDGSMLVYLENSLQFDDTQLRAVNADGSNDRTLLTQSDFDQLYPLEDALHYVPHQIGFIPGTHQVLFSTRATFEGPGLARNDDLYHLDPDSGQLGLLIARGEGGDFYPSPDGSMLALTRMDSVGYARIDGSGLTRDLVRFETIVTYGEYLYYPLPVWANDSSRFGLVIPSSDPLSAQPSGTAWIVPVDGSPTIQLGTQQGQTFFPQGSQGTSLFSSTLDSIAFFGDTDQANIESLHISHPDGSAESTYATGDLQWLGWHPDGDAFVYNLNRSDLLLGRVGQPPQLLGQGIQLRWIDSQTYYFLRGEHGDWTLMRGVVGATPTVAASPVGDFVVYAVKP